MGWFRSLGVTRQVQKADEPKPMADLSRQGQILFVLSLSPGDSRVAQLQSVMYATSKAVGKELQDPPYCVTTATSGSGFAKYALAADYYTAKGGNLMATYSLDEPSNIVTVTLEGDSRKYANDLQKSIEEAKIGELVIHPVYSS